VTETIEIANDDGFFDSGLNRYFSILGVSAHHPETTSFVSIHAKVDGREAQVRSEQSDRFHIEVPAVSGNWSRGDHIIELSYTAKNRFIIYDGYEDLNQNITGEWAVPIEKAAAELDFPAGVPPRLAISADTGSDSGVNFDCQQTNLPSGIRFETTHPLLPGERLVISARFMQKGYFVSETAESGMHAVFERYPLLSPAIWVIATLFVLTVFAYLWAPKGMGSYDTAPSWVRILVLASLPGTAALALRLVYEQTVMTWRDGEQMVGFALAHAYFLFYIPMLLSIAVAHFGLACVLSVTLARRLRKLPTPRWNWLAVAALAICTVLVYVPYDFWMTTAVRVAGPGSHGASFLMMAAADDKLSLARILIADGISPNTMAGGSTALDVACSSRNLDVARLLLRQGADISRAPSCTNLSSTLGSGGTN
jgi:ankyrin repeat protein/predicted membrane protein DUF2207